MEESLKISLPYGYEEPTIDDVNKAKKWTTLRNQNAARLSSLIESRQQDAIRELTKIGYKYNVRPEDFQFSVDENLREEVAKVMDELEDDIFELVQEYSLNESDDKKRRNTLLPWLLALHSNKSKDLKSTLHERLRQFLFDTEAQIAAMKLSNLTQTTAIGRALSTMHAVYASPEMFAAFKKKSAARYVRTRGVHEGNYGLSSSGAVNVENFGIQSAMRTWMRSQLIGFQEEGAVGYYQLRGSSYPCGICDDEVGPHIGNIINDPFPHAHCQCYRVPIYINDNILSENNTKRKEKYERLKKDPDYYDVEFNKKNSGLKATHVDHNFDKKGGIYEKHVQNAGYMAGNEVILEAEYGTVIGQRYTEGTWNEMKFEVSGRETATSNNIFRGLKHCASKGDTEVAVLDFPKGGFDLDTLNNAIRRYRGLEQLNDGQYIKFKKIICVQNEMIVYDQNF